MLLQLRVSLGIGIAIYYFILFYFLRKKTLSLKYTLLWIFFGIVLLLIIIFPKILNIIFLFGIQSPVNGIFSFILFAVLTILMSLTAIASRLSEKIKILIQYNAELELRVRELEYLLKEKCCKEKEEI